MHDTDAEPLSLSRFVRFATEVSVMPVLSTGSWTTSMRDSAVVSRRLWENTERDQSSITVPRQ